MNKTTRDNRGEIITPVFYLYRNSDVKTEGRSFEDDNVPSLIIASYNTKTRSKMKPEVEVIASNRRKT